MKKILLLLISLTISHVGYSQLSVGVASGFTHNTLDADPGYYEREYNSEIGYSIAIPVQYRFNDWFALRTELGYMTKSYSWSRNYEPYDEEYDDYVIVAEYEEYKNRYLSIPVMANFSYDFEKFRLFANVGAWVGAWLNGRVSGDVAGVFNGDDFAMFYNESENTYVDNKYEFDSRRDNRFDAGVLCGIGAEYKVNTQIGIFAEGRYMYGLTDMQKSYKDSYPRYNTTILVQFGVTYTFN